MALDLFSLVAKLTLEDSEYTEALDAAAEAAQAFAAGFGDDAANVGDNVAVMADNVTTSAEVIGTAMDAAVSAMDGVAGASGEAGDAIDIISGAAADASGALMDIGSAAGGASGDIDGVAGAAESAADSLEGIGDGASGASGGLDQAEGSAGGLASTLSGTLVSGAGAALTAIETMAVGAVSLFGQIAGAITDVVGGLAEYGDSIDKESQKLGISAQAYQEWDAVLQHSGTSIDVLKRGMMTMSTAMDELSRASERVIDPQAVEKAHNAFLDAQADLDAAKIEVAEAQKKYGISSKEAEKANLKLQKAFRKAESAGNEYKAAMQGTTPEVGKAAQAIQRLGVEMTDSEGKAKSQEEVFKEVITALQNIEDPAQRAATAQEIFGRSAAELGPLLNTSAEDTQAMIDRVHELGGVLSDDAVKGSAAFQDAMQDLKTAADGVKNQFIAIMMPAVTTAIENITQLIVDAKPIINDVAGALSAAWNGIVKPVLDALWSLASTIVGALVDLWQGTFVPAIQTAWEAVKGFWDSTLKPVWETLRDFVLTEVVPKVIDKWNEFRDNVKDAWQAIADYWGPVLQTVWDAITTWVNTNLPLIIEFWQNFAGDVLIAWQTLADAWGPTLETAWNAISDWVTTNLPTLQELWEGFKTAINTAWEGIKTAWTTYLQPALTGLGTALKNAWTKAGEFKNKFVTAFNAVKTGIENTVKTIKGWIDDVIAAFNKLRGIEDERDKRGPGGGGSANGGGAGRQHGAGRKDVRGYAAGGILSEGQSGIVGEYRPEYLRVSNGRAIVTPIQGISGRFGGQGGQEIIVPRADTRPIEITVRLADDTVLGRAIYRMNEAEAQRVGPKLVTGVR